MDSFVQAVAEKMYESNAQFRIDQLAELLLRYFSEFNEVQFHAVAYLFCNGFNSAVGDNVILTDFVKGEHGPFSPLLDKKIKELFDKIGE